MKMLISILISALLVSCPVLAIITLPNGFQFDETKYLKVDSRVSTAPETCEVGNLGCSNDCSAQLYCNELGEVTDRYECMSTDPYCVKDADPLVPSCTPVFPMEGACFTKAANNVLCSDDGFYADLTDCTKYRVCNGSEQHIEACPALHRYMVEPSYETFTDPINHPGNGEFKCRFGNGPNGMGMCSMCEVFNCDRMANQFTFRFMDYFHYVYCIDLGPLKKAIMFKCPQGTRHYGYTNTTTQNVDCVPIASIL